VVLAARCEGKEITTVEGLSDGGELNELQRQFLKHGALQCGYCTPGMLMAATALLRRNPRPNLEEIKIGLDGNLCRCTGYTGIFDAIQACGQEGK
jgi:carbon-monoxide dehydrogenase small subunit